jgi:hypothetical protein
VRGEEVDTLCEEDVHGARDGNDSQQEVEGKVVAKKGSRDQCCEYCGYSAGVLFQQCVSVPTYFA